MKGWGRWASALLAATALFTFTSCANMPLTESGFLTDYDDLEDAPEREVWGVPDEMRYTQHGAAHLPAFDAVYLEPASFVPVGERAEAIDEEDRERLMRNFDEALREELEETVVLVDQPGPGVLTLRAAITDAEPETPWINWVMLVLAVPTSYGGVSGEMELLDENGRQVAAMTAAREGTVFLLLECFTRWGHARHSMEKWGAEWGRVLESSAGL